MLYYIHVHRVRSECPFTNYVMAPQVFKVKVQSFWWLISGNIPDMQQHFMYSECINSKISLYHYLTMQITTIIMKTNDTKYAEELLLT